jgi:hypothetical protein
MNIQFIEIVVVLLAAVAIGAFVLIGRKRKPSSGQPGRGGGTGGSGNIKEV